MSRFEKCEKCHQFHWSDKGCDPEYLVYYEDWAGDEPISIRAVSLNDAALKFAKYYNERCDNIMINNSIEIRVERDGVTKQFKVSAEASIDYRYEEL